MSNAVDTSTLPQVGSGRRAGRSPRARVTAPVQLDLFGDVVAAERQDQAVDLQRQIDGLTCLRDVVPQALQIVAELSCIRRGDSRSPSAAGAWAWCVARAGLRFEPAAEWWTGARERREPWGWARTPACLLTWNELTALLGTDPRRAAIAIWARLLPEPRWQLLVRPHELGPDPDSWSLSYLCGDHLHPQWTARRTAWKLVLDLLTDTITTLTNLRENPPVNLDEGRCS